MFLRTSVNHENTTSNEFNHLNLSITYCNEIKFMNNTKRNNSQLTALLYLLAALLFATYGGRICPMLSSLSALEITTHVTISVFCAWVMRRYVFIHHQWAKTEQYAKLDSVLFFLVSIPLALYYNQYYQFTLDSNVKVLFGLTLFGFFTGSLLQLIAKRAQYRQHTVQLNRQQLQGERHSIVKQMIGLMMLMIITLTATLTMVAVKDLFWLEHNPASLINGHGKISIIKEFIYVSLVLGGYVIAILWQWGKLMKQILHAQEHSLCQVTQGDIAQRLPIFENNELGSVAWLTNKMLDSLQKSQDEVKTTRDVAIVSLAALAESRDNETGAHILRTQEYVKVLAQYLSQKPKYQPLLTPTYIDLLYKSAPLHDVGKVGIPDAVLLKPGKLTDDEFTIMKGHPEIGAQALSIAEQHLGTSSFLAIAKEIALTHHEKWDGSGYPKQLKGEEIPLSGRLMALADVYDALISKRVYKPAFSHDEAKAIILQGEATHFDPQVVEAFLSVEQQFVAIAARHQDKH